MKIPSEFVSGYSEPNRCFTNVARSVRDFGGSAVMGWLVSADGEAGRTLVHHCVWRKPDGETVDISPQFDLSMTTEDGDPMAILPPTVEFLPDATAVLVDGRSLCIRHEAKKPKFARMAQFLNRSERAFLAQDVSAVNYWTERADKERHRAHGHKYDPAHPTIMKFDSHVPLVTFKSLDPDLARYLTA